MPSIGGYTVIDLIAPVQMSNNTTELVRRDSVDGEDTLYIGIAGADFALPFVADYTTAANLAAAKIAFNNLVGDRISVVDNLGTTWTNLLVRGFNIDGEHFVVAGSGGINNGAYVLRATMQLRPMATYYG